MFSFYENNRKTYFDRQRGRLLPVWPRYLGIFIVSCIMSLCASGEWKDLLSGVLAFFAILVAASFSIMVFILTERSSQGSTGEVGENISLETKQRSKRFGVLGLELLHNIVYFNYVSLVCIVCAISLLVPFQINRIIELIGYLEISYFKKIPEYFCSVGAIIWRILVFILFFTMMDSILTFWRMVKRVARYINK